MDYLEGVMRRACGGVSQGGIGINVGGTVPQIVTSCAWVYDGAQLSGGTFTQGSAAQQAAQPDAIELIYPISTPTMVITPPTNPTAPTLSVADVSNFNPGDFALVTNNLNGVLFKVDTITPAAGTTPAVLTMKTLSSNFVAPAGLTLAVGNSVFRAASVSIYVAPQQGQTGYNPLYVNMLMLDPDGVAGADHTDADPLIDGVDDLQLAVGVDSNGDGILTSASPDEWLGDQVSELPMAAPPWNGNGQPQLRSLRATLLTHTINKYSGAHVTVGPYEDRAAASYPSFSADWPRYRPDRVTVSPRAWNLAN
jgi:hypothetical protein